MISISGENFTLIYLELLSKSLESKAHFSNSRIGAVKDLGPAFIEIRGDKFRMPLLKKRNFNPFFALAEFSWFILGSNNLEALQHYINTYDSYSDDGVTLNGAYGFRLREKFNVDQIEKAIQLLKGDKETRRAVVSMWSVEDLGSVSKDVPCNTSIMMKIRDGKLDMTVINRSNDLFLGIPYNVVLFYLFQCYMVEQIGCDIGYQRHFTDSLHLYEADLKKVEDVVKFNDINQLKQLLEKTETLDIKEYVSVNHKHVIQRNYELLENYDFRDFFISYHQYKEEQGLEKIISLLPQNSLGYCGYLWFSELRKFKQMQTPSFERL